MGNKKNKRVGVGMKPRGSQAPNPQPVAEKENVASTDAVQQDGAAETVLEQTAGEQNGATLEPESVQNLDSAETAERCSSDFEKGSHDDTGGDDSQVIQDFSEAEGASTLEALMKRSAETVHDAITPKVEPEAITVPAGAITPEAVGGATAGFERKLEVVDEAPAPNQVSLGERPDGTFGMVITIPEGYIEPIRQQADSDKITPEQWASERFLEYIESWWSAPKGR